LQAEQCVNSIVAFYHETKEASQTNSPRQERIAAAASLVGTLHGLTERGIPVK
jgi:hypothetical protein